MRFHQAFLEGIWTMLDFVWNNFPSGGTNLDNDDAQSMYLMGGEL